ncbi:hypothetical protein M5K25_009987 [Dendrobium thyrsiflorum]|uniref:UDP-glucose:glycoprotein glucosyltransferase n=1 Tax=Dendrobium thyrsiflorum TaxID=117978 RepID=A0ABD0VDZ1_DENTH
MDIGCRSRVSALCLISLLFLAFGGPSYSVEGRRPKNVQVSLRAKWPGTSLLLEAGELLSKEWKDLFWEFSELWLQPDRASNCSTARCCLDIIMNDGHSLLSDHLGSIFEFSLTLRSASPRLALYRQLAEDSLSSFPVDDEVNSITAGSPSDGLKVDHSNTTNPLKSGESCCWVDAGSVLLFNVPELLSWLDTSTDVEADSLEQPELFDFDHVYLGSRISNKITILYGALGMKCFQEFHVVLAEASKKGKIKYVTRPVLPSWCQATSNSYCTFVGASDAVNLGGYGVELALKNMEYKAMDDSTIKKGVTLEDPKTEDLSQEMRGFIFSKILERKPELSGEIMSFREFLLSSTISDTLEVWELKDLGHQTAQRIVHALDPLQSMQEINQNFPSIVSSLSRMKLNDSIKEEIITNQRMVPAGKSLMALNGALINIEEVDLYLLMDMIHEELSLADQFTKLKLPQKAILKLLSAPPSAGSNVFRIDFRSTYVHYLNNLEEDAMYRRWRSNINEILMPVFPGQLRYIRKNLFHAVYVIDPATTCGAETITMILSMFQNSVPMRFGVILYSSKLIKHIEENKSHLPVAADDNEGDDISSLIIRLFLYTKEIYGSQLAFQFLNNVCKIKDATDILDEEAIQVHQVEEAFVETVLAKAKSPPQDMLLKVEKEPKYKEEAEGTTHFVYKLGLSKLQCCLLLNGLVHEPSEDSSLSAMNEELPRIQEQVYYGQITSNTDVLEKFLSESGYHRYNPQVIDGGKEINKFVSLVKSYIAKDSILHDISYLHSPGTLDDLKPVTHLLAVNVTSRKGIKLLREGLRYLMADSRKARVGVLMNGDGLGLSPALLLAEIFDKASSIFSDKHNVLNFLDQLCSVYESQFMQAHSSDTTSLINFIDKVCELALANELPSGDLRSNLSKFSAATRINHLEKVSYFLHEQLGLEFCSDAIITNGRVFASMNGVSFSSDDLELLESVEYQHRIRHIHELIDEVEWSNVDPDELTSNFYSDLIMLLSSAMSNRERSPDRAHFEVLNAKHSAIILNSGNSSIHIDVVIDPLSTSGQKLAPLLLLLWKRIQPSMRIVLNPMSSLVDLPLKNYYRFVIPSMDDFSSIDHSVNGPKAFFANMPLSKTLTMNLDVPEPWLVEPIIAIHDLDNILLENLGDTRTLQAVFELEALLLTGHCSEKDHDPPRGLQLILGTRQMPHLVDTLVMANLGYWQMKVSPGVWYLQLAPGRSADLYVMKKNEGEKSSLSKDIIINDLRGKLVRLEVEKQRGKEHVELLSGSDDPLKNKKDDRTGWNANLLKWASGFIAGNGLSRKRNENSSDNKKIIRHGETINIFSVASGHLYERFLKIMILSVLKNTRRPVKFWFIKNYLSPQFKDVIPHMAQEYGFEYELITYKWPTWLHKQKEKQRIIWAYKILFLDVIFPISLKKVIFVDADQVVRTDMGILYDMDLKGRPLAYTPFCDNNKDMDGYRFWRQGFWKDHLRGRPYHISALYVVDLVKFRQMAAGDTLRVYYETLSKDPNSLSNLDQDLPNYAQHTVPIFSLPQEWLWCESWCGNSTKFKAKTIDLCNNPMTKEPKLQGAKRIVPEWVDLDAEARLVTSRILGEELEIQQIPSPPTDSDKKDDLESKAEL